MFLLLTQAVIVITQKEILLFYFYFFLQAGFLLACDSCSSLTLSRNCFESFPGEGPKQFASTIVSEYFVFKSFTRKNAK